MQGNLSKEYLNYLVLTANIPDSEANILVLHSLHIETFHDRQKEPLSNPVNIASLIRSKEYKITN